MGEIRIEVPDEWLQPPYTVEKARRILDTVLSYLWGTAYFGVVKRELERIGVEISDDYRDVQERTRYGEQLRTTAKTIGVDTMMKAAWGRAREVEVDLERRKRASQVGRPT